MQKIAFVRVHNACRSQIAEALGRRCAADAFESYFAGTDPADRINPDVVRAMNALYRIDMEADGQYGKPLSELPPVGGVVTMGCNVRRPLLPCRWREDWGLDDLTGQPDDVFVRTIRQIEEKNLLLKTRLR